MASNVNENVSEVQSRDIFSLGESNDEAPTCLTPEIKKRKLVSSVWNYAEKISGNKAKCKKCSKEMSISTSSIRYHLNNVHAIKFDNSDEATQGPSKIISEKSPQQLISSFAIPKSKTAAITRKISEMIAKDFHPFNMVMGEGFRSLVSYLAPGYTVPHRTSFMRTHLPEMYNGLKINVKSALKNVTHFTLTTDMWTDDYVHNSYISVTAHFIDDNWNMVAYVLATRHMKVSHTADNIAIELKEILRDWDLSERTPSIVTDEGANVIKAVKLLKWHHLTCFAHKLNLCLNRYGIDLVPDVFRLVNKCKEIVKCLQNTIPI